MRIRSQLFQFMCVFFLGVALRADIPLREKPHLTPEVVKIKQDILRIARANQNRRDNLAEVRMKLDPLVEALTAAVPSRNESEKLADAVGAWQQVWSDAPFYDVVESIGRYDQSNIYQVVFPNGYYWNLAGFYLNNGPEVTTFIRGEFVTNPDSLTARFTEWSYAQGRLRPRSDVITYAMRAELGVWRNQPFPVPPQFNPVGRPGFPLRTLYVDDDLRIIDGRNGSGSTDPSRADLFVLVRADKVK